MGIAVDLAQRAFLWACELDVAVRKPGNVSLASAGHGMDATLFIASATAAAAPLFTPGRRVGDRIEGAVRATLAVAGCNTNLGIVLLCAPLAAAIEHWEPGHGGARLRTQLARVLAQLDLDDASAAYRAIGLAHPGGLGTASQQDVAQPPSVNLREAMALAADRDRIAFQYQHAYSDLFELGVPAFQAALRCDKSWNTTPGSPPDDWPPDSPAAIRAMQRVFLEFLAKLPDSHIVRKHGAALAHCVMAQATDWRDRARRGELLDADPAFAAWDESLKARGLNPGTTADLCVATALIAAILAAAPRASLAA